MLKILFLILVVMSSAIFSQTQKPQSFKFDEFNEASESDWRQRFDKLVEMQKSFPDSKIGVIVYAQIGNDRKTLNQIKEDYRIYLTKTKKAEKFFIESGGLRKNLETELWIIPKNAEYPEATPDENFKPEKIAEFGQITDEQLTKIIQDFFDKLMQEETATAYIISYGEKSEVEDREIFIRDKMTLNRSIDAPRIVFVNGGENEKLKIQFWLVPQGAEPPMP